MSRVAVVTGGAGGIGGAIAGALADTGHDVAIVDREGDYSVDLAEEDDVRTVARRVLLDKGRCDVLVHSAAAFGFASLAELDKPTWRKELAVNVESALWLCQELTVGMIERAFGRIVMITSDTVYNAPTPHLLPYVASKAALLGVARTLARTLGAHGITVNCVAPGLTRTATAEAGTPVEGWEAVRAQQSVPRTLVPDDVAAAVAFLASDGAAAMTGQTLTPDGGLIFL